MKARKAKQVIKKDADLLRLTQEINTIHGLNPINPLWQEFPHKMNEYRKKLAEKGIINQEQLKTLKNKEIFLKYVNPVINKKSLLVKLFQNFRR